MRRLICSIRCLLCWRQTWDLVCLLATWMLVSALWTSAPAPVAAEPPPPEELIVIPRRVLDTCEDDARRVDRLEPALRACQRDLDAGAGARDELRLRAEQLDAERRVLDRRVAELEARAAARWSPLTWWAIGAGSAIAGVVVVLATR